MSVHRALILSFIDRNASLAVSIVSSMLIARLLTPKDIGVFSVTVVLMSFATTFRDFGAGQYLVQERELDDDRIRAVWTLQLGIGAALALLALIASVVVPVFYGEPRMRPIMWVLAASYLVNPFGSLTYAWLMRLMRFGALTTMRLSATLTGAVVSVLLAWLGHGPISLAWGSLASIVANASVSLLFRPRGFPLMPGWREVGRVLRFGVRMTSTSIIETTAQGAPELVLGKLQGLTALGLFSRANGLVALFARLVSDAVNSVAVPMFAKEARDGGALDVVFLRANAYLTALAWSFAAMVALLAHPLIQLLYGTQWDGAVAVTRWLAAVMAVIAPSALCYQALLGTGAAQALLRAMLIAGAATVLGATCGAAFGLLEMSWGLFAGAAVGTVSWLVITQSITHFGWRAFLAGVRRSALVAFGSAVLPLVTVGLLGLAPHNSLLAVAVAVPGAAAGFVFTAWLSGHPIADELLALRAKLRTRQSQTTE